MTSKLTLRTLLASGSVALAMTLPASAQDTETPAEAPAAETPAAEGTGDNPAGLSTGRPVGEALGGGPQIYVREEHGDWEVRCLEAPEGQEDPCQLYQRLADQQGNPTADINFFDLPDGNELVAGATLLTPLETLLTAEVTMSVDGGQPRRYPYSFCDQTGCYSRMGFNAADIEAFRRGAEAVIVVVPAIAPDQPARLTMSLSGFTAGFAAVEVPNPQ